MIPVTYQGKHIGVIAPKSPVEWIAKSIYGGLSVFVEKSKAIAYLHQEHRLHLGEKALEEQEFVAMTDETDTPMASNRYGIVNRETSRVVLANLYKSEASTLALQMGDKFEIQSMEMLAKVNPKIKPKVAPNKVKPKDKKKAPKQKKDLKAKRDEIVKRTEKITKELTPEQRAEWRSKSKAYRRDYLKKYPNSPYKDVKVIEKLVTRSKKLSGSGNAKELQEGVKESIAAIGYNKVANFTKNNMMKMYNGLKNYSTDTNIRKGIADKSKSMLGAVMNKISRADRQEIQDDLEDYDKVSHRQKFSSFAKGGRGRKVAAVVGVVALAAIGVLLTGAIMMDPGTAAYIGVKILDSSFGTISEYGSDIVSGVAMGSMIGKFFGSSDSDEHMDNLRGNIKRKMRIKDDDDDLNDEKIPEKDVGENKDGANETTTEAKPETPTEAKPETPTEAKPEQTVEETQEEKKEEEEEEERREEEAARNTKKKKKVKKRR